MTNVLTYVLTIVLAIVQTTVPVVTIETSVGSIDVEIDAARAPITAANFLKYVDARMYDGGRFHRAVRLDNQVRKDVMIQVIQGGRAPEQARAIIDDTAPTLDYLSKLVSWMEGRPRMPGYPAYAAAGRGTADRSR